MSFFEETANGSNHPLANVHWRFTYDMGAQAV